MAARKQTPLSAAAVADRAAAEIAQTKASLREQARQTLGVSGEDSTEGFRLLLRRNKLSIYPIFALGMLYVCDGFQGTALVILSPNVAAALGLGITGITAARSIGAFAALAAPMPMAALTQHKARRALLCVITGIAWSFTTLFTGFIISSLGLFMILILDGLSTGSVLALHPPLIMDNYHPSMRVRALSAYQAIGQFGGLVCPLLVALLTGPLNLTWRGVFLVLGLTSLAMSFLAVFLRDPGFGKWDTEKLRDSVHASHDEAEQLGRDEVALGFWEIVRRVMMIPTIKRVLACAVVLGMLLIPFQTYISFFLLQRWNLSASHRALFFAYTAGMTTIALMIYGGIGERQFRRTPAQVLRVTAYLQLAGIGLLMFGGLSPWFGGMLAGFGLGSAVVYLLFPAIGITVLSIVPSHMRAHAQSVFTIFVGLGSLLGGLLLGNVENQYGPTVALIVIVSVGLFGAGLLLSAAKFVVGDLDRMIDDVLEEEEIKRITAAGTHLPMLACRGIDFSYGQLQVLFDVDFTVDDGEMVALLGTNGAGKSTLLKVVSGIGFPSRGSIRYRGQEITYLDAERRLRLGITQIPGGRAVFGPMTVLENLRSYGYSLDASRRELNLAIDSCFEAFPRLYERRTSLAATLSGGEQQMLGLSKALMLKPRLLVIDELSLGLAPVIVGQLLEMVKQINSAGTAVVLVEQSVNIALNLVEHAYFMEKGEMRFDGKAADLLARDDLLRAVFLQGAAVVPMKLQWRWVIRVAAFAAAVVVAKLALIVLANHHRIQTSATPTQTVVLGAITGMTYGLLGVGLVLVYRSNRIINFAHGNIGAFGAAFFGVVAVKWHVPYWIAFVLAMAVSGLVGVGTEAAAVRRLRDAPLLMSVVVTLGIGQFLVFFSLVINSTASAGATFPSPPLMPTFHVQALFVTRAYSGMLILSPLVVVALAIFLRVSKFGLGLRAAAANPEAARMAGIFAGRMSSLAWGIAGSLSAFTAILITPAQGFVSGDEFGPDLILRAMAAAAIGGMDNLPATFFAGIGLGVIEGVLEWDTSNTDLVQLVLFVFILIVLLLQRRRGGRGEEKGTWASVQALRPLPEQLRRLPAVRLLGPVIAVVFFGLLTLVPLVLTNSSTQTVTFFIAASIVGLSITVITGLGGQLTLGQFTVAAIGAVVSFQVSSRIGDFPLALLYAGLAAGVVSVLVGLPALRLRGLMLTITTLGFAIGSPYLLSRPFMFGQGVTPGAPIVDGRALDTGHSYYYFALAVFFVSFVICANVRRSGFGRLLVAVRDNEDNARAFTVRATLVKMQGYLIAGFIAGVGGAVYVHSLGSAGGYLFSTGLSIQVVVMTVLGGISSLAGPILGCAWIIGIPKLPNLGNLGLAATYFGATGVILWRPNGLISFVEAPRRIVVTALARLHGIDGKAAFANARSVASVGPTVIATAAIPARAATPVPTQRLAVRPTILEARGLVKRFGGVTAVNDVSFSVLAGETLGLIGPNGAGKTTTFELLGGFTKPDRGSVTFERRDVSDLGPEGRARLGLIRSFQDAALFPTMTVEETVTLAQERISGTSFIGSVLGISGRSERAKKARARELISMLGLDSYRDRQIRELSTGTRRISEIACLVALEPTCLLLDEPSSGIAQRETEGLGVLLDDLKRQLDLTLVVIEHDIPLIMGISDRIVAMADGSVIAEGTPEVVRNNAMVIDAYLGGSITAIERSGAGRG